VIAARIMLGLTGVAARIGAQAVDTPAKIKTPHVDWVAIGPASVLVAGAFLLLVIGALARHTKWIRGVYVWFTLGTASAAGLLSWFQWDRIHHKGPQTAIHDAVKLDGFAVFFAVITCCAIGLAALVGEGYFRREELHGPEFFVLMLLSGSGGVIMAQANDLIVLFLGLEILSIALYVLAGSHLRRAESQESAMKYFILGAFSSAVFLYGVALLYGTTGSTNLGEIATYLSGVVVFRNGLLTAGLLLVLVGLGFKVAAVPFHMWTPDVYQGSPSPVTGFMAAAAKAAGFAGLLRVFLSAMSTQQSDWRPIVWVLSILSMLLGSFSALVQHDVKRMMAYSSISHAGFIMIGLQAATKNGTAGSLFYLFAYTFIVLGSFAVISVVGRRGDAAHSLEQYGGLAKKRPALALAFTLFLLAQAGIPATSGFIAKFGVISAAVEAKSYVIAIVAMVASVVAAFFYLRIVVTMWTAEPSAALAADPLRVPVLTWVAVAIAAAVTLYEGIIPQGLIDFARHSGLFR
jgi:NADH-quinone oxidoreductase subunit N